MFPPFSGPKYDLDLQSRKVSESVDFLFGKEFKFLQSAKTNVTKMSVTHAKEKLYFLLKKIIVHCSTLNPHLKDTSCLKFKAL